MLFASQKKDPARVAKAPRKTAPAKKPAPPKRAPATAKPEVHSTGGFKAPIYTATKAEMLDFYEQMLLIRRFEEKAGQLYGLGLIGGFCHLYIGQEAVVTGLQSIRARTASLPATVIMAICWLAGLTRIS